MSVAATKTRLDEIIKKSRVDMYKPIQVAETLRYSRLHNKIDYSDLESFRNDSLRWRDVVTKKLLGKVCTSSARFQHDIWSPTAFPPNIMEPLDAENNRTDGGVERYIYHRFKQRHETVGVVMTYIENTEPPKFCLKELLELFITSPGIKRSIDKAYEIVTHSLFETIVTSLKAVVTVSVADEQKDVLKEFPDLTQLLLGVDADNLTHSSDAHVYRVGVTNAADRGLDMWANFGPVVQVKHMTLNPDLAVSIIDQVESDNVVVVCKDSEAEVIKTVTRQIRWGIRIRGIVTESDLIQWYDKCLRGSFSDRLANPLIRLLIDGFRHEFPQNTETATFISNRGYDKMKVDAAWEI